MGQKVFPLSHRLGVHEPWRSRWFVTKGFKDLLEEDIKIRRYLTGRLRRAAVSRIDIERKGDKVVVELWTARPGIVIGKKGAEVDVLRKKLESLTGHPVAVNIVEIKRPETDATLVAQALAEQLEARVGFRRAMKKSVQSATKSGALGIRVQCAGRLGGTEMSRREWYREGRVPLHTIRAVIDYGTAEARTTFGRIGVKVWVYKGEVLPGLAQEQSQQRDRGPKRPPRREAEGRA